MDRNGHTAQGLAFALGYLALVDDPGRDVTIQGNGWVGGNAASMLQRLGFRVKAISNCQSKLIRSIIGGQ